jgi:hypothetical protein
MRAAGGAKITCFTFDHDKVPDQDVRLQRARKNGQMKTTYLVEVVVCTPQAAQNDVVRAAGAAKMVLCVTNAAAGAAKMVFCVTNAAAGAAKNHSLQLGSLYVPPPASHSSVFPWQEANQFHAHLMPRAIDNQSSSPAHLKSARTA